jgi:hypothetical protein
MKILSVDVGIRNLSFCFFEINNNDSNNNETTNNIKIIKWDNIDLTTVSEKKCVEIDNKGVCNKAAKFITPQSVMPERCYCLKHSKKHNYLQPTSEMKPSFINKQKIQNLFLIADKYKLQYDKNSKKADLISLINGFISKICYVPVEKKNASKMDLVMIGRNIQHKFDEILVDHLASINTIIIENQIGPIANKMKTIQGMLSQYFIMRNNNIQIEFISAINKLKSFIPKKEENLENLEKTDKQEKMDYKKRKQFGIQTCMNYVEKDDRFKEWSDFLHKHNKKDDLSDCFLQGMWYITNKI